LRGATALPCHRIACLSAFSRAIHLFVGRTERTLRLVRDWPDAKFMETQKVQSLPSFSRKNKVIE
jgi:hypothetical protein